jgi:hypothetical protein
MKRLFVTVAVLFAAGCGSSSAPTSPPAGQVALIGGPYTLRIAPSAGSGTCFNFNGAVDTTVQLNVNTAVITDGWRVSLSDAAAGSLVLTLNRQGGQVTGQAVGRAVAGSVTINLDHPLTGGPDTSPNGAAGVLTGNVSYEGTAGATTCTENRWTLTRRS